MQYTACFALRIALRIAFLVTYCVALPTGWTPLPPRFPLPTRFPKCRGRVEYVNIGTPLTNEFYLGRTDSYVVTRDAMPLHLQYMSHRAHGVALLPQRVALPTYTPRRDSRTRAS